VGERGVIVKERVEGGRRVKRREESEEGEGEGEE
jgi:hypothetical protein